MVVDFTINVKREFCGNYGRSNDGLSGGDAAGAWERLVFVGIDFRFENG